jgi:catechol 2,3-dioxygenase-like lactoylglutathione lyase family enzyme
MATVQVRYIVHDVDAAIRFYCTHLGFKEVMHPVAVFAMLTHGDLRLVLSAPNPAAGGGQPMPDGTKQSLVAGTGLPSRCRTSPRRSIRYAKRAFDFETTS